MTKRNLLIILVLLLQFNQLNAQIKLHAGGFVNVGPDPISVSGFRMSLDAENCTGLRILSKQIDNYAWSSVSIVDNEFTKNWIVSYNNEHKFYVYGNGEVWGTRFIEGSDSTIKENIQTLTSALQKVRSLRGVSYDLKKATSLDSVNTTALGNKKTQKVEIGLIAQEVELVVPEVVSINENGVRGVAYQNLVAILIEAMKEQSLSIDSIEVALENCCNNSNRVYKNLTTKSTLSKIHSAENQSNLVISYSIPVAKYKESFIYISDLQGKYIRKTPVMDTDDKMTINNLNDFYNGIYNCSLVCDGEVIETKQFVLQN
jgi:hypothetical protein